MGLAAPWDWEHLKRVPLEVGTEIVDVLKTGKKVSFVVMDKGVIGLKNCLSDKYKMNCNHTNIGGWSESEMRRYLNEEIFGLLHEHLQRVINTRNIDGSEDKLWLFSETEIFGKTYYGQPDSTQKQFAYFKDPKNRIITDCNGEQSCWWERSPSLAYSSSFCAVDSRGNAVYDGAGYSYGVRFGFYI